MQQRGIERVEAVITHYRKTGDRLFPELEQAYVELSDSYKFFNDRSDWAAVALGRIWLGNIMRMRGHWQEAINFYHEGYERAKQAGHTAYQAKARIEEARTHVNGFNDLGAAGTEGEQPQWRCTAGREHGRLARLGGT